jgi:hypothetical protein
VLGLPLLEYTASVSPVTPSEMPTRKIFEVPIPDTAAMSLRRELRFDVIVEMAEAVGEFAWMLSPRLKVKKASSERVGLLDAAEEIDLGRAVMAPMMIAIMTSNVSADNFLQ